jgi:myo-inositol-1(or 4)-monophosphatase
LSNETLGGRWIHGAGPIQLLRSAFEEGQLQSVSWKSDDSPVSNIDIFIQDKVLAWRDKHLPGHVLVSEELAIPEKSTSSGSVIILDPLDGTENFISGIPLWASGLSVYTKNRHVYSVIVAPELDIWIDSTMIDASIARTQKSRIRAFSSSLSPNSIPKDVGEYRVLGSAMVNFLMTIQGSFRSFSNPEGSNSWDIMPGLNLALAAGLAVVVDDKPFEGQLLWPDRKYSFSVSNREELDP